MKVESFRATAHEVARLAGQSAAETDREGRWPGEALRAAQAAGLGGLAIPVEMGGLGAGAAGLAEVCEIIGSECASTAICLGMHSVGAAVIAARPTPTQIDDLLQPIARGEHLTTLALSEPGTGVHFYLPQTTIEPTEDGYRITGTKSFVTNGGQVDSYVMSGVSADGRFSCVVVPSEAPGLNWVGKWEGLGMRGNSSITAELDGVEVPADRLLGTEGDQIWYVFNVVAPYFLVAMAATYMGVASAAFEVARDHLGRRVYSHNGAVLSHTPVLQHRLGDLWGELDKIRQLVHSAARRFDEGATDAVTAVMAAKAEVAETAVEIVNEAMTLCGGAAYRDGGRLHQLLRDVRAAHVMAPTTDTLRTWIGRALLDVPLLAD